MHQKLKTQKQVATKQEKEIKGKGIIESAKQKIRSEGREKVKKIEKKEKEKFEE